MKHRDQFKNHPDYYSSAYSNSYGDDYSGSHGPQYDSHDDAWDPYPPSLDYDHSYRSNVGGHRHQYEGSPRSGNTNQASAIKDTAFANSTSTKNGQPKRAYDADQRFDEFYGPRPTTRNDEQPIDRSSPTSSHKTSVDSNDARPVAPGPFPATNHNYDPSSMELDDDSSSVITEGPSTFTTSSYSDPPLKNSQTPLYPVGKKRQKKARLSDKDKKRLEKLAGRRSIFG